jgi:hypothetical protein
MGHGPEYARKWEGQDAEAWVFWPDDPPYRCQWPTAALAARILARLDTAIPEDRSARYAIRAIIACYLALQAHPVGVEPMVQRLRALRRAERGDR